MGILKKGRRQDHKFCPVCGAKLKIEDVYCTRCGYSFEARHKKTRKNIKWKNIILLIIVLILAYLAFRYFSGQPIIPPSIINIFNSTSNQTG